ncbi:MULTISPECIES: nickel insertion protein [Mesobacillus]|uniref:DUF111 family protein n=2 Tax=Mesobacillus TaxID=2675231 RepID=A0A0D6ZCV3_9BACI|nr:MULTISPECIES: nickel insertion protein [Mesobacillus]KIY23120.1 hypothetical protein UB32_04515 [Mesobacillus subterraneus]MDQ0415291.1 uncharacterized protein (DUF111 family) [Mesobacillus stamsii]
MKHDLAHRFEHLDENMMKVEVNLDDISSEWLGYVMDLLFEVGVNDVFYIPIYMKKNRPGVMLQVLCDTKNLELVKSIIFAETTTLGIRYYPASVHRLERRFIKVDTHLGRVSVKQGFHKGMLVQQAPEYEDCRKLAEKHKIPLQLVFQEVWKEL